MLVCNLNNNRSRKLAWMREAQWSWYLIHTDRFEDTTPLFGVLETQKLGGKFYTNLIDDWYSSGL